MLRAILSAMEIKSFQDFVNGQSRSPYRAGNDALPAVEELVDKLRLDGTTMFQVAEFKAREAFLENALAGARLCLYKLAPLLAVFPGLKVSIEKRAILMDMGNGPWNYMPPSLYDNGTWIITPRTQNTETEGIHEVGHHIHSFFDLRQNEAILSRQQWWVCDETGRRTANVGDIARQGDLSLSQPIIWEYGNDSNLPIEGNRFTNPCEMIADIFAENALELVKLLAPNNPWNHQRQLIISEVLNLLPTNR